MKHYKIAVAIFIASTLIALVSTTIYVAALFTWNPPPETNYVPIVISYPDSMFMPMYGDNATICTIKFLLEFNGTISENTQIKIINATCWSYVPYNIIVYVGFPQAIPYDFRFFM